MPIKLSICIPTFNRAGMLRVLLESISAQDMSAVQIAISDNASTDNTEDIVRSIAGRFPNFDYHRNETNIGADRNFRAVVAMARGDYCIIMGSDDAFPPDAIDKILEMLRTAPDIFVFNRINCDFHLRPLRRTKFVPSVRTYRRFECRNEQEIASYFGHTDEIAAVFAFISNVAFRVDRWKAAKNADRYIGTAYLHVGIHLETMRNGCSILYSDEPLVMWRSGNDSFNLGDSAARVLLDLRGYEQLADDVFGDMNLANAALKGVVVRFWTNIQVKHFYKLLAYKMSFGEKNWEAVTSQLRKMGCPSAKYELYDKMTPVWTSRAVWNLLHAGHFAAKKVLSKLR